MLYKNFLHKSYTDSLKKSSVRKYRFQNTCEDSFKNAYSHSFRKSCYDPSRNFSNDLFKKQSSTYAFRNSSRNSCRDFFDFFFLEILSEICPGIPFFPVRVSHCDQILIYCDFRIPLINFLLIL